jgi:hypothetical protein
MRPSAEEHIKAMQDFLVADRDASIAEYQERADARAAIGDESFRKMYQDHADALRATRFPWETGQEPAEAGG